MFVLLRFFFLAAFLTSGLVNAANELDIRLDRENKEDVQRNYLEARNKLQVQVEAAQKEIDEFTELAETEKLYGNDISEMVAQALQPLSELVEEKRVLLAAYLSGYVKQFSANDWQAGAFNNVGVAFYGSGTTRANAESAALAKARASETTVVPAPAPVVTTYTGYYPYSGALGFKSATSTISQSDANNKAYVVWQAAQPVTYTGYYPNNYTTGYKSATSTISQADANNKAYDVWRAAQPVTYMGYYPNNYTAGYKSATSTISQVDANNKAYDAWRVAQPVTYTGYYPNSYTTGYKSATSTISQVDANTRAQQAWQAAQPPTWTGNFNGATVTSMISRADADRLARLNWLSAQVPSGTNVVTETYDSIGWKPITNSSNNVSLNFQACATADMCVAFKYGTNQYVEIVIGALNNTKSLVRNYNNSTTPVEVSAAGGVIPNIVYPVSYSIKFVPDVTSTDGSLIVAATTLTGVVSTPISIKNAFFNQRFAAYSFKASSTNSWRFTGDAVTSVPLPYTAKYNGIDGSSLVSQEEANQKAQDAWGVVEQAINLKAQALQAANTKFSEDLVKTTALAKELIQIFKSDTVSSVDTSSWNLG